MDPPDAFDPECYSCQASEGTRGLHTGAGIFQGEYWNVRHAYPTSVPGWSIMILKRHARAPHELSKPEIGELGMLLGRVATAIHDELGTETECVGLFAEKEHFRHVHVHLIPRSPKRPAGLNRLRLFSRSPPGGGDGLRPEEIGEMCRHLRRRLQA